MANRNKYVDGVLVDLSTEEITAKEAQDKAWADGANARLAEEHRITRNNKLSDTDFYALSDVTMSSEMQTYRQALRDITSHSNWPNLSDNDWPTKP